MKASKANFQFLIRVPASTSNLGPGFDVLGLAVNLHLGVGVEPSAKGSNVLLFKGVGSDVLSQEGSNLILRVAQQVARAERVLLPPLRLTIHNEIPLARGLGSSAAAIVAGVSLAELFSRRPFPPSRILEYALEFESHPDNLAACLMGGLTAARLDPPRSAYFLPLSIDRRLKVVFVVPEFTVSTVKARRVLPRRYAREDVVTNLQNAVLLSQVLSKIPGHPLRRLFVDRMHQPFRASLVPGLQEALALPQLRGLVGVFLSGSGPTLAALATENYRTIGRALQNCFSKHGLSSTIAVLNVDRKGRSIKRLA
ncbi:MAG: homoserine kinase [Acidobacteriia bacterium]|nr:homoserine kinase [Terriglobia bacterium]